MLQKVLVATMVLAFITGSSAAMAAGHNWNGLYLGFGGGSGGSSGTVSGCAPHAIATATPIPDAVEARPLAAGGGTLTNCTFTPTATPSPTPSPTPTEDDESVIHAPPSASALGHFVGSRSASATAPGLRRLFNAGPSRQPFDISRPLATILGGGFSVGTSNYGMVGGALAGYNFQANDVVFGVESEVDSNWTSYYGAGFNGIQQNWLARIRGRFGFTRGNWLFYGAAGYSQANYTLNLTSGPHMASNSLTVGGYNAGAGAEYAFGNVATARVEYIHDWYNSATFVPADPYFPPQTYSNLHGDTVRVAFTWKL